jgi:hypothetical protein
MQFLTTRFADQKEGPPGANQNGPKKDLINELHTLAGAILQSKEFL